MTTIEKLITAASTIFVLALVAQHLLNAKIPEADGASFYGERTRLIQTSDEGRVM